MASPRSGSLTVTTAGTAVKGPANPAAEGAKLLSFYLKAATTNTAIVFVGESGGTVTSITGFSLAAGDTVLVEVNSLDELWFNASADGQKVLWLVASA